MLPHGYGKRHNSGQEQRTNDRRMVEERTSNARVRGRADGGVPAPNSAIPEHNLIRLLPVSAPQCHGLCVHEGEPGQAPGEVVRQSQFVCKTKRWVSSTVPRNAVSPPQFHRPATTPPSDFVQRSRTDWKWHSHINIRSNGSVLNNRRHDICSENISHLT